MTGTTLEIDVLGPLRVRVDGEEVHVPGPRRRAVLALLAVSAPDTVSVDGLLDAVWGEEPPDTARNSLQSQVSRLRSHLAAHGDRLERLGAGYRLNLDPGALDLDRVRAARADARGLAPADPAAAAELLRQAVAAWRGSALGEFAAVPPLAAEAAGLAELRAALVDERSELLLAAGDVETVVEHAVRAAADAPLRERSQLVAMRALAAAGRAPDALRHAAGFRRHIVDATGLDPSDTLAELEQAIASGEHASTAHPPPRAVDPVDSALGLPRPTLPLLGRADEVEALARALEDDRLVTLIGPGGVGKTRLATEVAARDARTAGFVALAELDDPDAVVPALATSLGLRAEIGGGLPAGCISRLSGGPTLLVVDNCEHVISAVRELVGVLLARCPDLTVLATSREALDLPEERLVPVGPLPVPPAGVASDPRSWPSVELFARRAERVAAAFRREDVDWQDVAAICRELDGLPLALELAAGRVGTLGTQGLRERMGKMLDVVVGGRSRRTGQDRHAGLADLVRWSYDLLAPGEARLFRHLSVFPAGFDLEAAELVASSLAGDGPTDAVARLAETSLITVSPAARPRYGMLNTIRAFGAHELDRHGEQVVADDLLVAWACSLVEDISTRFSGPHEAASLVRLRTELGNLRAARRVALDRGDMRTLALIVTCLRLPMGWALQRELFGWALELAEDPRLVGDPQHAEVLAAAGFASGRQGDLPGAARYADEGLAAALTAEQRAGCTDIVASVALLEGRPAEAADLWLNAGVERTWETLASAAIALGYAGRPEEAIRLARQALTDARTAGAPIPIAFCCYTLGELLMGTDEEAAEALLREGVELDPPSLGGFTGGLAQLTLVTLWQRRGDRSAALSGYRDLVDRWWRSGSWTQEWTTLRNLADLLASTSERPTALLLLTAAAQTTSAPALSAAEGARLDRLRSDLEAELGSRVVDEPAAVVHDALAAIDRLLET